MNNPIPPDNALTQSEQAQLEEIANEVCDSEFTPLWDQTKDESINMSKRDLAEEFFYQGVLTVIAMQRLEEKEIEEQEARRFQNE